MLLQVVNAVFIPSPDAKRIIVTAFSHRYAKDLMHKTIRILEAVGLQTTDYHILNHNVIVLDPSISRDTRITFIKHFQSNQEREEFEAVYMPTEFFHDHYHGADR